MSKDSETSGTLVWHEGTKMASVEKYLVMYMRNRQVASVDLMFDFSEVDPKYVDSALRVLADSHTRIRYGILSPEQIEEGRIKQEKWDKWKALPWWKRIFAKRPGY